MISRPKQLVYSIKRLDKSNVKQGVKRALDQKVVFRMKEHAYMYKSLLQIYNKEETFIVDCMDKDDINELECKIITI